MNRTVTVKLCTRLNCCVGDAVTLNVSAVQKLTSYGSSCETSGVPALIVAVTMNSDDTYTYIFRYDSSVLLDQCNYLLPTEVQSVCCVQPCGDPCYKKGCGCD